MLPATVVNGQLQTSSAGNPADMLLQHEAGPYTVAHMTAGLGVQAWQLHILRLAQAVLALHQLDGTLFKRVLASLEVSAVYPALPALPVPPLHAFCNGRTSAVQHGQMLLLCTGEQLRGGTVASALRCETTS